MNHQKLLQQVIGVTLLMLLLVGCGAPTATPVSEAPVATPTPAPSTATPTPMPAAIQSTTTPTSPTATLTLAPSLILYLREDDQLSESPFSDAALIQTFAGAENSAEWRTTLRGDIEGTMYEIRVFFASYGNTTYQLDIIHDHKGNQTVLATTSVKIGEDKFKLYPETVSGTDPDAVAGDMLIFRMTHIAGDSGAAAISPNFQSHIALPPYAK
jgi:hypothetical protein